MEINFEDIIPDNFERALESADAAYQALRRENKRLRARLENYNRDSALQELRELIDAQTANAIYIFSDEEKERRDAFIAKHSPHNRHYHYIYHYYGSELGDGIDIKCPECGACESIVEIK